MTSHTTDVFAELIGRYNKWRRLYTYAGKTAWDEPIWEGEKLNLRFGYPHMDWVGYIIEPDSNGFDVLRVTTERRNEPHEGKLGFFSNLEDAGKYIIWNLGENLRVDCQIVPLTQSWVELGLDPRVKQTPLDKYVSKYELLTDPARYFILQAGGIQPENRMLPLTYDELDAELLNGMPESVTSRL